MIKPFKTNILIFLIPLVTYVLHIFNQHLIFKVVLLVKSSKSRPTAFHIHAFSWRILYPLLLETLFGFSEWSCIGISVVYISGCAL